MSRIGKQPVSIPDKVKVTVNGENVLVEGPKGKVQKSFAPVVKVTVADKKVTFAPTEESRFAKAMYGTARSVVAGMVKGVTDGYTKDLEIQGVGFKAALKGKQLVGAITAEIRGYYPPEPYKGKGVRIVGERVRRKEGKTVA